MEIYLDHAIATYRSEDGYWHARCVKGEYKNLASMWKRKKTAVNMLKQTLLEVLSKSQS